MDWKSLEQTITITVNSLFTMQGLNNDHRHIKYISEKCFNICKRHIEFNIIEFSKSTEPEKEAEMTEDSESVRTTMLLKKQINKIDESFKKYDEEQESLENRFRHLEIDRYPPSLIDKLVRMLEQMKDYEPNFFLNIRDISLDSWKESLNFEKILQTERKKYETILLKLEVKYGNRIEFFRFRAAEKIIRLEKELENVIEDRNRQRERLAGRIEDLASWIRRKSEIDSEMLAVIKQAGYKGFRDVIRGMKNMEKVKMKMNSQIEGLGKEIKVIKGKLSDSNIKGEAFKRKSEMLEENLKDLENSFIQILDIFVNPGEKKNVENYLNEKNYAKLKDVVRSIEHMERKHREEGKKEETKKEEGKKNSDKKENAKESKNKTKKNLQKNEIEAKPPPNKNESSELNKTSKPVLKKDPSAKPDPDPKQSDNSNQEKLKSISEGKSQSKNPDPPSQDIKPSDLSPKPPRPSDRHPKPQDKSQVNPNPARVLSESQEILKHPQDSTSLTPRAYSPKEPNQHQILSNPIKSSKFVTRHRRSLDVPVRESNESSHNFVIPQKNPNKTLKNSLRKIFSTEVLKSAGSNIDTENSNLLNSIQNMNLEELLNFKLQVNGETKSLKQLTLENIQNAFKQPSTVLVLNEVQSASTEETRKKEINELKKQENSLQSWRNLALKFFVLVEKYLEYFENNPNRKIEDVLIERIEEGKEDEILNYLKNSDDIKGTAQELALLIKRDKKYELLSKVLKVPVDLNTEWKSDKVHIFNKIRWRNLILKLRQKDHMFLSDLAFRIEVEVKDKRKKTQHSESNSSIVNQNFHNYSMESIALNEVKNFNKKNINISKRGLNYFLPQIKTPRDKSFASIPNSFITSELWIKNK